MTSKRKINRKNDKRESGAALVTTVVISLLLMTACISMLLAAGSHSRNVSDILSETKAYYAAESGIQATVNVLRGNTAPLEAYTDPGDDQEINYTKASMPGKSNLSTDASTNARLSRWLNYNYTPPGAPAPDRVIVGTPADYHPNTEVAYSVEVSDPDNTSVKTVFTTVGSFEQADLTYASSRVYVDPADAANTTTVSFVDVTSPTTLMHPVDGTTLGSFQIVSTGAGARITDELRFRINYKMSEPRDATRSIRGSITQTALGSEPVVTYDSYKYLLVGGEIFICENGDCSQPGTLGTSFGQTLPVPTTTPDTREVFAHITPVEPYRLLLRSTGYGPNGARKQLEAIIQRNFFNDLSATSAVAMIGPSGPGFVFEPGESAKVTYCGIDIPDPDEPCVEPAGGVVVTVPSIGLTDQDNLEYVLDNPPKTAPNPPPALLGDEVADWQQSPEALDELVVRMRTTSQNSIRYFTPESPPTDFGSYEDGKGITFCEGACELQGEGGGILVVTGTLTLKGNFSFRGLIIVTGEGGVIRKGGGNGQILGNLVIAPYDPANLAGGFLPPKYDMSGGGISDIIYSSLSTEFDGQTAVSDFVQGVAEK